MGCGSCASHRLAELAVGLAIVLLLALIVVLWTGSAGSGGVALDKNDNRTSADGTTFDADISRTRDGNEIPHNGEAADSRRREEDAAEPSWSRWKDDILPSVGDAEYVVLAKANQNSFEDPLEEHSKAERHHSGHFRQSQNKVWDPHPQYEFTAFGKRFHLSLKEDNSLIDAGFSVTHIGRNTSRREYPETHTGCFYNGYVEGDPKSSVAVSLCHGMAGHITTSTGTYSIKPTERWSDNEKLPVGSPLQHVISRESKSKPYAPTNRTANDLPLTDDNAVVNETAAAAAAAAAAAHECGVIDSGTQIAIDDVVTDLGEPLTTSAPGRRRRRRAPYPFDDDSYDEDGGRSFALEDDRDADLDVYGSWRTRRALPREYFIEIMVVADAKMIDYHGDSLTHYILVLMNTVSRIYKDPSIGNPISIAVIKIKQVDEVFGARQEGSDGIGAAEMLKNFCHWQTLNNPHEPSPEHHDAALLLTRENLCHNPREKRCDTLGLAELGRMCSPGSSCAIVQDNGLATAFTIAHEIGHVLNMPHDDDPKCSKYQDRSGVHNIMSRMLDKNTVPWEWSKCSRHYVTEFLDAGNGNCLLDEPRNNKIMSRSHGGRLPGEDYSENKQCELVYGTGSEICPHMVSDVCKRLWCTVPYLDDRSEQCHTQHMPWADGTYCCPGKWCHRGECVSRENLEPVDGQWGEWSSYGECSRTCGGGIKKKYRECNNPAPKNGGNYCIGERVRYRSCGTKECEPGSPDFREQQCAKYNNDNRNIRNLSKNVKWQAKYTRILPEDRCKLYCHVASNQYYMLQDKVIDGTPCSPDTFHVCVNGQCKPAGCDHMLNSPATLDNCGVCQGDNSSCRKITGSYNSSEYGYTRITKIPAGSSYIDIRQHGWMGTHNDSNYLALRLKDTGKYILNGNFMVMHRKVIVQPGITVEYSGPEPVVERLNSSRPIQVDLILEVLSVGNVNPPQITYEYLVPKDIVNSHTWNLSDWTECDRPCQGTTRRRAFCRSTESNDIVADGFCPADKRPQELSRGCNSHCELQWQEIPNSKSECSNHCGKGTLLVKHRCVKISLGRSAPIQPVASHVCYHLDRPLERRPCVGPCDFAHWRYGEWSPCSVSCGDNGVQYRKAECVDRENRTVPEDKCPSEGKIAMQTCGHKSCPKWDLGEWSPCSVSCGIGTRERRHWCRVDNHVVHRSQCKEPPTGIIETCDAGPCATWQTGEWSACSVSCGDGVRRRIVVCRHTNGTINRGACESSVRPIESISCSLKPCPTKATFSPVTYSSNLPTDDFPQVHHENDINNIITFRSGYKWSVEDFDQCSKSCGGGFANQIIRCISVETNKVAPDDYCDSKKRPPNRIACNKQPCPTWTLGSWSQCDVKCGDGYQHRQVLCQDRRGEILNESDCSEATRPRHAKKCQRPPCRPSKHGYDSQALEEYRWRTSLWSDCSVSCGNGVKRREVTCHRINSFGWEDPTPLSSGCSLRDKPPAEQACRKGGCNEPFYWMAGNWRKCSHPCGRKGRQVRRLFCLDRQGRKVRRRHCPINLRPQRKRKCNPRPCTGPTSCLEVQSRLKTNIDGEYTLLVGGRYMSIYCHGMESHNEPQEYLTLPTGERENFAEIYDKRLQDPSTCPYDGNRNDSCQCMSEPVSISGRSMFKKIRINVHTLHIVADDFKFATKVGKNNIEYGKAGDCYSQMDCPQGRFGINLSGTLLMLSPNVHWPKQKNSYTNIEKITNQRVVGTCGGYCGFCTPSPSLKLNVLPP